MKKITALLMALLMITALCVSAFAVSVGSPQNEKYEIKSAEEKVSGSWQYVSPDDLYITNLEERNNPDTKDPTVVAKIQHYLDDAGSNVDDCAKLAAGYTGLPKDELSVAQVFDITKKDLSTGVLRITLKNVNISNFACLLQKDCNGGDWFVIKNAVYNPVTKELSFETPGLCAFAIMTRKSSSTSEVVIGDTEDDETVSPVTGMENKVPSALVFAALVSLAAVCIKKK